MSVLSSGQLRQRANDALRCARYDHRRLALLSTGIAGLISLLLTAANYFITQQMEGATGLSGVGLRATLSTAQSILSIASAAVVLFWNFGFTAAGLGYIRKDSVGPQTLLEGFRRWGGVLRLNLLQLMVYMLVGFFSLQIASVVYTLTPFSAPVIDALYSAMESGAVMDEAMVMQLLPSIIPMYILWGVVLLLLLIPVMYLLRMAEFALLDSQRNRALMAMLQSVRLMSRNCFRLVRLDLHFWWYYVLLALAGIFAYGDMLLSLAGIPLPISADAALFLFYGINLLLQLGISYLVGSKVITTYAAAYDAFLQRKSPSEP